MGGGVRTAREEGGGFPGISRFNEVRRAEWPEARGIIRAGDLKFSPTLCSSDPRPHDWGMSRVNNMLIRTVLPCSTTASLLRPSYHPRRSDSSSPTVVSVSSSFFRFFFHFLHSSLCLVPSNFSLISRKANACYSDWGKNSISTLNLFLGSSSFRFCT